MLFVSGFIIGYFFVNVNTNSLVNTLNSFEDDISDLETSLLLLNSFENKSLVCGFLESKVQDIKTKSEDLRNEVVQYEKEARIYTSEYRILKRKYMYMRIKHWLLLRQLEKECNVNYMDVLFFYSTERPCQECDDEGLILSYISEHVENFVSFPLDYDENIPSIQTLARLYNITETPSIVIEGQYVYNGLITRDNLYSILCDIYNTTSVCLT